MSKKVKGILINSVVLALCLCAYNLLFFLLPVSKANASLWPTYVVTTGLMICVWLAIFFTMGEEGLSSELFKTPCVKQAHAVLFVQIVVDVFAMVLCAYYKLPLVIILIIEVLVVALYCLAYFLKDKQQQK